MAKNRRSIIWFLSFSLLLSSLGSLSAQEVISSATGEGYGMSGAIDSNAAWLTMGTAIRVIPSAFVKETTQDYMSFAENRYRYLPFALYLFPEGENAPPATSPVYYNLHLSPDGSSFVRSTLPAAFNLNDSGLAAAFRQAYQDSQTAAIPRVSPENLFTKRMLEVRSSGKGFMQVDWSEESHPALVKQFFFSEDNPLAETWASWFSEWADANRAILSDYCATISYFYLVHGLSGQDYALPNAAYQTDAELAKVSMDTLYRELVAIFEETDAEEQNWALIFEPVADFYPQGQQAYRAWTSAAEIAQVMAERVYAHDPELYEARALVLWGEGIKPQEGHNSRYQAALTYDLRNSGAFGNFVFGQTRAIFSNNYSSSLGDYLPDKYLLVDSLRPEEQNENGFLGGWGIIYIKDVLPAAASVKAMKYALLVDQQSAASLHVYGNLGYFGGKELLPELSYRDRAGTLQNIFLTSDRNQVVEAVGSLLGLPGLKDYASLNYVATRTLVLSQAILPADFADKEMDLQIDATTLERLAQPVGADVIGTARYTAVESSIVGLADRAIAAFMTMLQEDAVAHAVTAERSEGEQRASISVGAEKQMWSGASPDDYADSYKRAEAALAAQTVVRDGQPLLASNRRPLLEISGTIPMIIGVKLPEIQVQGRFITVDLDEEISIVKDEREAFEVSESLCRPVTSGSGIREIVVLGWKTEKASVHPEAIASAIRTQLSQSDAIHLDQLKADFAADYASLKSVGDTICGASSKDPAGHYDGFTAIEVVVKQDQLDLSIETLESTVPVAGETAIATVCVGNSASAMVETELIVQISSPAQTIRFPVELQPGLSCLEVPYGTPLEGGSVEITATVNPEHDPVETDYGNNTKDLTIYLVPPQPPYNPPVGCTDLQTWTESRTHSRKRCVTINKITSCWTEYCTHTFQYSVSISAHLDIDDYEGQIKSGYGIAPKVTVTGSGPMLIQEIKGGNCWGGGPSALSEASIHWPDQAYFGWYGGQGHSLRDYVIVNSERNTRQEYDGIALEHSGTSGSVSAFQTAPNPLSNTAMRRIYTNVSLRDGEHPFFIHVQNGAVRYGEWSGCLATVANGSILIQGNMYTDDFTGATIP